jgi:predicted GIY-YIG superfamily endonuclease
MWHVYILECMDGSLYTGVTTDLKRRLKEHRAKTTHYTSYNPPRQTVYAESFSTRPDALKREAQIKGWTRRKKLALIAGDLPSLKRF